MYGHHEPALLLLPLFIQLGNFIRIHCICLMNLLMDILTSKSFVHTLKFREISACVCLCLSLKYIYHVPIKMSVVHTFHIAVTQTVLGLHLLHLYLLGLKSVNQMTCDTTDHQSLVVIYAYILLAIFINFFPILIQFHEVWGQLMKTGYQNSRFAHQVSVHWT